MNPFKRPNDRYGSSAPVESPYLRASREWDNRIGSAVVQAKNWRMAAFGVANTAATLLGGVRLQRSIFPVNFQVLFLIAFAASMVIWSSVRK